MFKISELTSKYFFFCAALSLLSLINGIIFWMQLKSPATIKVLFPNFTISDLTSVMKVGFSKSVGPYADLILKEVLFSRQSYNSIFSHVDLKTFLTSRSKLALYKMHTSLLILKN